LNDDDDEIRNLGASTVSSILKVPLVPLGARTALGEWMLDSHDIGSHAGWSIICRMTGNNAQIFDNIGEPLHPAKAQFSSAMRQDDALFVEEEQNLFIDEVKETKLWSDIFTKGLEIISKGEDVGSEWYECVSSLASWVIEALDALNALAETKEDGPLGWTSKPSVFASCMRVIKCANTLLGSDFTIQVLEQKSQDKTLTTWEGTRKIIYEKVRLFSVLGSRQKLHPALLDSVIDRS